MFPVLEKPVNRPRKQESMESAADADPASFACALEAINSREFGTTYFSEYGVPQSSDGSSKHESAPAAGWSLPTTAISQWNVDDDFGFEASPTFIPYRSYGADGPGMEAHLNSSVRSPAGQSFNAEPTYFQFGVQQKQAFLGIGMTVGSTNSGLSAMSRTVSSEDFASAVSAVVTSKEVSALTASKVRDRWHVMVGQEHNLRRMQMLAANKFGCLKAIAPTAANCPDCCTKVKTTIKRKPTKRTFVQAVLLFPLLMCFQPFLSRRTKKVVHRCPMCKGVLGVCRPISGL